MFSGRHRCVQEEEKQQGVATAPAEGVAEPYLSELRVMMRRLLQDEDIYNTVR